MINLVRMTLLVLFVSCQSTPAVGVKPDPDWNPKVFVGDATKQSIVRAKGLESISCAAPEFSRMLCVRDVDFQQLVLELQRLRDQCGIGTEAKGIYFGGKLAYVFF